MQTREILGWCGACTAFLLFIAGGRTYYSIWRNGAVGANTAFTAIAMLLNCSVWAMYGLPFVGDSKQVLYFNAAGVFVQILFIALFLFYAPAPHQDAEEQVRLKTFLLIVLVVMADIVLAALGIGAWDTQESRCRLFGGVGAVFAVVMYAAPLKDLVPSLISTRDVGNMSLPVALASLVNASIWVAYGYMPPVDHYVAVPNTFGVVFALFQLVAYGICRQCNKEQEQVPPVVV